MVEAKVEAKLRNSNKATFNRDKFKLLNCHDFESNRTRI
jgi:hypothetical protein